MSVCVNDAQQVEVVISTSWHEKGRISATWLKNNAFLIIYISRLLKYIKMYFFRDKHSFFSTNLLYSDHKQKYLLKRAAFAE